MAKVTKGGITKQRATILKVIYLICLTPLVGGLFEQLRNGCLHKINAKYFQCEFIEIWDPRGRRETAAIMQFNIPISGNKTVHLKEK